MAINREEVRKATEFFDALGMKRHGWLPDKLKVAFHAGVVKKEIDQATLVRLGKRFAAIGKVDAIQPHIKQAAEAAVTDSKKALHNLLANIGETGKPNMEEDYNDTVPPWARKRIEVHLPSALLAELKKAYYERRIIREPRGQHNFYGQNRGTFGGFFHAIGELLPPAEEESEVNTPPVVKRALKTIMQHAMHIKDPRYKASYLRNALFDITTYWYGSVYQDELRPEVEAKIEHFIARHKAQLGDLHVTPEKLGKLLYAKGVSHVWQSHQSDYLYIQTPLKTAERARKFADDLEVHLDPAHFEINDILSNGLIRLKSNSPEGDEFISKVKLPDKTERKGLRWQHAKSVVKGVIRSSVKKSF